MKIAKGGPPPCRFDQSNTPYRVGRTEEWAASVVQDRSSKDRSGYHRQSKQFIIPPPSRRWYRRGMRGPSTVRPVSSVPRALILVVVQPFCNRCAPVVLSERPLSRGNSSGAAPNSGQRAFMGGPDCAVPQFSYTPSKPRGQVVPLAGVLPGSRSPQCRQRGGPYAEGSGIRLGLSAERSSARATTSSRVRPGRLGLRKGRS